MIDWTRDALRLMVKPGSLCFDIGANIGNKTALMLQRGAQVVAVEPQSSCQDRLVDRFGRDTRVTIVRKALGESAGEGELRAADDRDVLASLSADWVSRVTESDRFPEHQWDRLERVQITTLDALISRYGEPRFCKIDVEGFEPQVLAGLSTPIRALSFEFTPERLDATEECVSRLAALGRYCFNFTVNESFLLCCRRWRSAEEILRELRPLEKSTNVFGDVYASRGSYRVSV